MMKTLTAIVAVSTLMGCADPDSVTNTPDLDLETAKARATELGVWLRPKIDRVGEQITSAHTAGDDVVEANQSALTEYFGPPVPSVIEVDGQLIDDSFYLGPSAGESPSGVRSVDGRLVLISWSLSGGPGFFYEPTVLDTRIGSLYQGFTDIGKNEVTDWRFFGPLAPPLAARVTGDFDSDDLWQLYTSIRAGLWQNPDAN